MKFWDIYAFKWCIMHPMNKAIYLVFNIQDDVICQLQTLLIIWILGIDFSRYIVKVFLTYITQFTCTVYKQTIHGQNLSD